MKNAIIFLSGVGIGSVATYFALKKYFEQKADAEIEEMDAYYREKNRDLEDLEEREKQFNDLQEEAQAVKIQKDFIENIKASQYTNYSGTDEAEPVEKKNEEIYQITDKEFGQFPDDDWDDASYTWYEDTDELVDEYGETIDASEVENILGKKFRSYFGKNKLEPDLIMIRNEGYKRDYEVVRDHDRYDDSEE